MKREIILLLMVALCLAGCGREENPYRVDTVIQIPVDPTNVPTEPEPTEIQTEPETAPEEETSAPTEKPAASGKTSGSTSKKTSSKSSGTGKTTTTKKNSKSETASDSSKSTQSEETHATGPKPTETEPVQTVALETEPPSEASTEPPTEPATEPPYDPSGYRVGSLEYAVLDQINGYREEAGLPPLSMDEGLCAVASVRAYEISVLWSHTRPDGRGYKTVLSDYGYSASGAAENLIYASGNGDAAKMVAKWMSAEKNYGTLMSESYTTAGIGIYRSGGVTYLANLLIG